MLHDDDVIRWRVSVSPLYVDDVQQGLVVEKAIVVVQKRSHRLFSQHQHVKVSYEKVTHVHVSKQAVSYEGCGGGGGEVDGEEAWKNKDTERARLKSSENQPTGLSIEESTERPTANQRRMGIVSALRVCMEEEEEW